MLLVQASSILAILDCAFAVIQKIETRRRPRVGATAGILADLRQSSSGKAIALRPDRTATIQAVASDAFRRKRIDAQIALTDRRVQRRPHLVPH